MKYVLFLIVSLNLLFCRECIGYEIRTENNVTHARSVIIPINDIFEDKHITQEGCKTLEKLLPKFKNNSILIEVFCSDKLDYEYTWEAANVYAYQVSMSLIKKGFNPQKLRYIGYGNLDSEKNEPQNSIKITVQDVETILISN